MGCENGTCSTDGQRSSGNCNSGGCQSTGCEMCDMMMMTANKAWEELMIEKMKAHFEKMAGDKMDHKAQIAAEMCMAYWMNKMEGKAKMHEHKQKMQNAFMGK